MENYQVLETIGRGSFGTVSKIRRRSDGKILVWKELSYGHMSEKEKQLVVTEVNVLRELRHPYIVRYYDRIIDKARAKLYIIMEYCDGGDLGRWIRRSRREGSFIEEDTIWRILAQIVMGLKECHRRSDKGVVKPIIHRDIKPGNILLDRCGNVKLGDFGLSKELASQSKYAYTNVGTPFYMSPEMINELRYNERSDIWAVGCLLYELAAHRPPFEASNQISLAVKINAGRFNPLPPRYSEDLYRVIRWMLHTEQSKRPSVEELERLSQVQRFVLQFTPSVREAQARGSSEGRLRDARTAEEQMARREQEAARKEQELARKGQELARREHEVAAREALVAAKEQELDAREKRMALAAAAAPAADKENNPLLQQRRRWGSAGDVLRPAFGIPPQVPAAACAAPTAAACADGAGARLGFRAHSDTTGAAHAHGMGGPTGFGFAQ